MPRLFASLDELVEPLRRARSRRLLHTIVQAYMAEVASRLSNPMTTVHEIQAVAGARNDGLSVSPDREILWEIFGTKSRVEEDFRKLETDRTPRRLKVAVVLDHEVDAGLVEHFTRSRQNSSVHVWYRVSDLMLTERFHDTVAKLERHLDGLVPNDWPDQLELVEFNLDEGHRQWAGVPSIPFCYNGLHNVGFGDDLEDPVFFLDVRNIGSREARISAAFINVRCRHIKLHGIPGENVLKPACTIILRLNRGEEGYREDPLRAPVLVPAGKHVRVLVRLDNAGYGWMGEVDIGLRYGPNKVLRVPALSLFR